ncbi:hypothetical protein EYC80_008512 [Monilinia laxa]|uniref:BRCT domain-containing protein n=1 Tax=Monilinia laxa TaxID=61186 RepID=A0A5N6JTC8_MONLA|nr:hypothetical protein EYC80_008512 [Monilinia laxa]
MSESGKIMADPKLAERREQDDQESQIEQDQLDAQLAGEIQKPKLTNKEEQDLFDEKRRLEDAKIFSKPNQLMFNPDWLARKAIFNGNGDKLMEELAAQRMKELAEDQSIQPAENTTDQQTVRGANKSKIQKTAKKTRGLDAQHNQQNTNESASQGTNQQDESSTRDKSVQTDRFMRPAPGTINHGNSWIPSAEELSQIHIVRVSGPNFHESLHATMDSAEAQFLELQLQKKHAFMEIVTLPLRAGNTTINEYLHEKNLKRLKELYEKGLFDNLPTSKKKTVEEIPEHWAEKQDEAALDMDPPVPKKTKVPRKKAAAKPRAKKLTARENALALVEEEDGDGDGNKSGELNQEEQLYLDEEEMDAGLYSAEERRGNETASETGEENEEEEDQDEEDDQLKASTKKTGKAVKAPKEVSARSIKSKASTNKTGVQHDVDKEDHQFTASIKDIRSAVSACRKASVRSGKQDAWTREIGIEDVSDENSDAMVVEPPKIVSARAGPRPKSAAALAKERNLFDALPQNYRDLLASTSCALSGKILVLSGVNPQLSRKLTEELILKHGGKVSKVVTGRTHYAVVGADGGDKMVATIAARNVATLDEDALITLLESANAIPNLPAAVSSGSTSATTHATASAAGNSVEPITLHDDNNDDEDEDIQPARKRTRRN